VRDDVAEGDDLLDVEEQLRRRERVVEHVVRIFGEPGQERAEVAVADGVPRIAR